MPTDKPHFYVRNPLVRCRMCAGRVYKTLTVWRPLCSINKFICKTLSYYFYISERTFMGTSNEQKYFFIDTSQEDISNAWHLTTPAEPIRVLNLQGHYSFHAKTQCSAKKHQLIHDHIVSQVTTNARFEAEVVDIDNYKPKSSFN